MRSAKQTIKKAVKASIDALMASDGTTARAYAGALDGDTFPYVKLGAATEADVSDGSSDCSDITQTFTVWDYNQDEAERLAGLIQEELTGPTKLVLDSPFSVISQTLDLNPPTETDELVNNTIFGASVRVRFQVDH